MAVEAITTTSEEPVVARRKLFAFDRDARRGLSLLSPTMILLIVALARKLVIALWRFAETGLVPDGAECA